ncbi:PREDICTED: protein DEHYDRATION-INDUCED 19 homolog 7-like isoform X2 [Brassica oleracea var. oleracea]|uniref:protein DEHYDRATION-INDUCED 19 homolog 7-like isoform X2 n=1 Tax=Brassica oleracea var. oleracea TaxID=109376 RepID=UPI0006A7551C|nr:PREDICTED: protein DEHYDRATION-INDUCED 19 homolog 7-like isoform X2 [Brassica oleracea var. oleracea]
MESNSLINYPSRSDLCLEEDVKGEDNVKAEFICPFCADEFDILGLCCHIDEEHPVEAKNGVCPVCSKKVGLDIVGHITTQHCNVFKVQRRRRLRRGGYSSNYLTLRKSLGVGGASTFIPSSNLDSDPLLSSFMFRPPLANELVIPITEGDSVTKVSPKETSQRLSLSNEDQEKARKSEFVRDLLWSTMLEDKF